jgi:hypothetical protein
LYKDWGKKSFTKIKEKGLKKENLNNTKGFTKFKSLVSSSLFLLLLAPQFQRDPILSFSVQIGHNTSANGTKS